MEYSFIEHVRLIEVAELVPERERVPALLVNDRVSPLSGLLIYSPSSESLPIGFNDIPIIAYPIRSFCVALPVLTAGAPGISLADPLPLPPLGAGLSPLQATMKISRIVDNNTTILFIFFPLFRVFRRRKVFGPSFRRCHCRTFTPPVKAFAGDDQDLCEKSHNVFQAAALRFHFCAATTHIHPILVNIHHKITSFVKRSCRLLTKLSRFVILPSIVNSTHT